MQSWDDRVLPHGELIELQPGLWQVTGSLPRMSLPRNMVVYRLADGGLLIHSCIALNEKAMDDLEALGQPRVLIVPSRYHRMDAPAYKARYPDVHVLCPEASRRQVEKRVAVEATCEETLDEYGVTTLVPAGVKPLELVYELDVPTGKALVFNDLLFNLSDHLPGFSGWVFKHITRSTGHFGVTRIGKAALVKDKHALAGWLREQAERDDLTDLCVAHGGAVEADFSDRLREAANGL